MKVNGFDSINLSVISPDKFLFPDNCIFLTFVPEVKSNCFKSTHTILGYAVSSKK